MTNSIKYVLAFSAGAAIGVAVSWRYMKTKYERIAQKEIDGVKEYYREVHKEDDDSYTSEEYLEGNIDEYDEQEEYKKITDEYSTESSSVEIEDDEDPYIITPEELGDIDEYDTTTLYYYADGVLTTLEDEIVEDVAGKVGEDFADHYGEYEDDSVCVRSPKYKCDYEILKDLRRYSDVKKPIRPHEAEE